MKKLKQSIFTDLPPAKLFLDDLEKIDKILKELCSSYTITIDEYELDSINEIKEIEEKQDFYNLKITSYEPYFILNIGEYNSIISNDNTLCIGIIERIKPIIQKRRKTFFYYFIRFWTLILNALLLFSVFLDKYYTNIYSDFIEYIILGIMMIVNIIIVINIISTFRNNRNKSTAFTTKKSNEQTNYFIKNKDPLISGSIGAICATLLRFILDLILAQYTP